VLVSEFEKTSNDSTSELGKFDE